MSQQPDVLPISRDDLTARYFRTPHNDSPLVASTGSAPLDAPTGGAGSFIPVHKDALPYG